MDQEAARQQLGVEWWAEPEEILRAYRKRSVRLKRLIFAARDVAIMERLKRALRNLIVVRDLALGAPAAADLRASARRKVLVDDWWTPEAGVPLGLAERGAVLAWLGLGPHASPETVRRVFHARSRTLKLNIARARSDYELHVHQDALRRLNDLLDVALQLPAGSSFEIVRQEWEEGPAPPRVREETLTEWSSPEEPPPP